MALAKFSKFKQERSAIKEARSKETKIKLFQKLFNEKLGELGLSSTADLSEDQINKVIASLSTVNEDRMREIEKDGIIAGTPKPAGSEGDVAKKHTFDSPQTVDTESEIDAEGMKANEAVNEAADIKSEADFDKYADDLLKKAHPDDFDEAIAKKVKDGLKKKYKDDYGAMVGALTSGFGG
jgi:hypothetical protein